MSHIPIVMAFNEAYAMNSCVTIYSALRSKKVSTKYAVSILVAEKLSQESLTKFDELIKNYPDTTIDFIEVGNQLDNVPTGYHFSKETYYRLLIPKLFPQLDKCIYLDGDIIVCDDLTEMWNYDLGNNYIAGVKNVYGNECYKSLKLSSPNQYICAGSLLMNIKAIRKDNLEPKLMELICNGYKMVDQDVLNIVCYDRIAFLPLKFNIPFYEAVSTGVLESIYPPEEVDEALSYPVIIHYAGGIKPWNSYDDYALLSYIWFKTAFDSPYKCDFTDRMLIGRRDASLKKGFYNIQIDKIQNSISYRIGLSITFIPRYIFNILKKILKKR